MKKISNWFNYPKHANQRGEVVSGVSLTVPGQVLSLDQLLKRYVSGGEVYRPDPVFDAAPHPDIVRMDPMERLDLARTLKQQVGIAQEHLAKVSKERLQSGTERPKADAAKPLEAAPQAGAL